MYFRHLRWARFGDGFCLMTRHDLRLLGLTPDPRGGITIATRADGATATARCRRDENFSRARGRQIATNRLTSGA